MKIYLDNTLLQDEPKGIEGIEEVIKRDDEELGGIFISYESDLTFWGDGYRYIWNKFKTHGFCEFINIRILDDVNNRELKGIIRITACEFDLQKYTVNAPIDDDNFGAYIFNNKNIKAKLDVGKSKNGMNVAPAAIKSWQLFNPQAQTGSSNRYGITYYDAMAFLVRFMSDGKIGFKSDFLQFGSNSLNWGSQLVLMLGLEIRLYLNRSDSIPTISFQEAFDNLRSLFPVLFGIEIDNNGQVFLRIETEDYFASNQNALVIDYQDEMILSFDTYKLYSHIKLGSGKVANYNPAASPQIHSFPPIRYIQFQQEEYQLQGTCNIDKMKDLSLTYITDHNIIEELVETNTTNSNFDNDVFIIQCVSDNIREALIGSINGINAWLYNVGINNENTIQRQNTGGNIAFYLNNLNAQFEARKGITDEFYWVRRWSQTAQPTKFLLATAFTNNVPSFYFKNQYPNEIFDNANAYSNVLFEFVAPVNGYYVFDVEQTYRMSFNARYNGFNINGHAALPAIVENDLLLTFLSNNNTFQFEFSNTEIYDNNIDGEEIKTQKINKGIFLTQGQKVVVRTFAYIKPKQPELWAINANNTGYQNEVLRLEEGVFRCVASLTGGGEYKIVNKNAYRLANIDFPNITTQQQWDNLKFGIAKSIYVNRDGSVNNIGWIKEVRRNWITSATNFTTITDTTNIK